MIVSPLLQQQNQLQQGNLSRRTTIGGSIRELGMWILIGVGLFLTLALATYTPQDPGWSYSGPGLTIVQNASGFLGAWLADLLVYLFGYMAYLFPTSLIFSGIVALLRDNVALVKHVHILPWRWLGFLLTLGSGVIFTDLYVTNPTLMPTPSGTGGVMGQFLAPLLFDLLSPLGGLMAILITGVFGFTILTGCSWLSVFDTTGGWILGIIYFVTAPFVKIIRVLRGLATTKPPKDRVATADEVIADPKDSSPDPIQPDSVESDSNQDAATTLLTDSELKQIRDAERAGAEVLADEFAKNSKESITSGPNDAALPKGGNPDPKKSKNKNQP
ncbi:hypothetical protein TI04_03615 [Achromatium sp. WMS2]|nr:hypothetical protein TI04_03615 [Achromatium sp. WMS2]